MKNMVSAALCCILAALSFSAAAASFPKGYTAFGGEELEKAKVVAQAQGKNILLVLSLARCPGCDYVMGQLWTDELRQVYQPNFIGVYTIWQETVGKKLWDQYAPEFRSAPHFILLTPKGEPICRAYGGFNTGQQGRALGEKMLALSRPAGVDPTKYRLPECSLL